MRFAYLIPVLMLAGCACDPVYVDRPVEVLVPISADIPEPPTIQEPFLATELITEETPPDKVAKYYVQSIKARKSHAAQLECALDAYRTNSDPTRCPKVEEDDGQ